MKRAERIRMSVVFITAIAIAVLFFGGCGESKKEAALTSGSATGVAVVGFTECYNCHADSNNPASFPIAFGDQQGPGGGAATNAAMGWRTLLLGWLNGPHGNYASWNGTSFSQEDRAPANTGFPDYAEVDADAACAKCHDPLADGKRISDFFTSTGVTAIGILDRPVVGCETCHGAGGDHWGLGPIANPKPGPGTCGTCHNSSFRTDHLTYHPEGANIIEDYSASKHASSIESHTYVSGSTTEVTALCSRCHTDQGARGYMTMAPSTLNHDSMVTTMNGKPNIPDAAPVQCKTCHDGHNQYRILGQKAIDAGAVNSDWSDEFATCTTCHQLLNGSGNILHDGYHSPYDAGKNAVNPYGSWESYLPSTHFDNPATPTLGADNQPVSGTGAIEGYIVNPFSSHDPMPKNSNSGTCRDCHNEHKGSITINRQWAKSAHGGFLLDAKEAAAAATSNVYTAGVTEAEAPAWFHYNWKDNSRLACQRCHTSTGFRNYANNQLTYDANSDTYPDAPNDFQYLDPGGAGNGRYTARAEVLYCWACHTDNVGGLRDPGAINANYNVLAGAANDKYAVASYQYPDVKGSNVCMGCHTGRENGDSVALLATGGAANVTFANRSFINSHYLTAGGTVFTATGYERFFVDAGTNMVSRDYNNPASYMHDHIGTTAAPGTGSNGPCVGCHMSASESHLFLPVQKDVNDAITAITSPICTQCHPGGEALSISPGMLESQKTVWEHALKALQTMLDTDGYYFRNGNPYFFKLRTRIGIADATAGSNIVTGGGTANWSTVATSDYFRIDDEGTYYAIGTVTGATNTLSLKSNFGGSVNYSGTNYTIIRGGSSGGANYWLSLGDADGSGNTTGKNNMGSAFSYNLLSHDFGAYAHNRYYNKRLIYDAIDWLDDNVMNYSTGTWLNSVPAGTSWKANAMSYLLVNGTATGTSAERP